MVVTQSKSAFLMFWPCLYSYFLSNKIRELQKVSLSSFREQNPKEDPKLVRLMILADSDKTQEINMWKRY